MTVLVGTTNTNLWEFPRLEYRLEHALGVGVEEVATNHHLHPKKKKTKRKKTTMKNMRNRFFFLISFMVYDTEFRQNAHSVFLEKNQQYPFLKIDFCFLIN
eukprot:Pompholyxophrys_punicea_v1_NODE_1353_length_770_cov_2.429371.p2 type:complete len:101 gc:universal NODE_1353_length_770_cov_2.429371:656-354(-)